MSRPLFPTVAGAALALTASGVARPVHAEAAQKSTDGVYGRFDGDLDLSLAAGAAISQSASGAAIARVLFLGTAGVYGAYTDKFGDGRGAAARTLAAGFGIRPLFLPRWGYNMNRGPALLDLTIDATTLDLGILWPSDERGHFAQSPGFEFGLGTEVPLAGGAAVPWIGVRGALRWREAEFGASSGSDPPLQTTLFLTLNWHFVANAHLVDMGDQVLR